LKEKRLKEERMKEERMKEERLKEPALDEFYHRVHGDFDTAFTKSIFALLCVIKIKSVLCAFA
jgi:hypothetical protein